MKEKTKGRKFKISQKSLLPFLLCAITALNGIHAPDGGSHAQPDLGHHHRRPAPVI
jgi:hypothetical protein